MALFMPSSSAALSALGVSGFAEPLSALVADLSFCLSLLLPAAFLSESGAALFLDLSAERLRECLFLSLSLSLPRSLSFSLPLCLSFSLLLSLSLSASLARSFSLRSCDLRKGTYSASLSQASDTSRTVEYLLHGDMDVMSALHVHSRALAATLKKGLMHRDIHSATCSSGPMLNVTCSSHKV